jgi:hypothetical protein
LIQPVYHSEIAEDINGVNQATSEFSNSSSQINLNAEDLSHIAGNLKEMLARFKISSDQLNSTSQEIEKNAGKGNNQKLIEWNESLLLGIEMVDQQHMKLVGKVMDYRKRFEKNEAFAAMDLMEFLKDWLIKHIKGTDTKYVPFVKDKTE